MIGDGRQLTFENLPGYYERAWRTDRQAELDGLVLAQLREEHPRSLSLSDLRLHIDFAEDLISDSLVRLWVRGVVCQVKRTDPIRWCLSKEGS